MGIKKGDNDGSLPFFGNNRQWTEAPALPQTKEVFFRQVLFFQVNADRLNFVVVSQIK